MTPAFTRYATPLLIGVIVLVGVGVVLSKNSTTESQALSDQTDQTAENLQSENMTAATSDSDITSGNGNQSKATIVSRAQDVSSARMGAGSDVSASPKKSLQVSGNHITSILKDVGEAAYTHFGLKDDDFQKIRAQGFDVIEGNNDICADDSDVQYFLDAAHRAGLKVIMNAGSGEAEYGYSCDNATSTPEQKPVWQKDDVQAWVAKWKNHPALYAWDTSNEDGGVFPYGTGGVAPDPNWETKFSLSVDQLRTSYQDVKEMDPIHPVMIRMNGWYFYDNNHDFFRPGNAFGKGVADLVMVNAYSNVQDYFSDFVPTVLSRAQKAIASVDSHPKLISSLGVWTEPPMWFAPTPEQLEADVVASMKFPLAGMAYFKYGARQGSDWFLPDSARGKPALWNLISTLNHRY